MGKLLVALFAMLTLVAPAAAAKAPVQIQMRDPGCHFFYVGGKLTTKYVSHGKVTFVNLDEAALLYRGPHGFKAREAVGAKITLSKPGVYKIKMVGQAPDDKILTVVIK